KGETRGPLAGDQIERRLDQRLAQIAVVIAAALPGALMSRPPHVNDYNIDRGARCGRQFRVSRGAGESPAVSPYVLGAAFAPRERDQLTPSSQTNPASPGGMVTLPESAVTTNGPNCCHSKLP